MKIVAALFAGLLLAGFSAAGAPDTALAAPAKCGDGIVGDGEQCDAPGTELCTNFKDDDGDGRVDCADPDCSAEAKPCGTDCQFGPVCRGIEDDPAVIVFAKPGKLGFFRIHGRIPLGTPDFVPLEESFTLAITNDSTTVYIQELPPGNLEPQSAAQNNRFGFKNRFARDNGGFEKVSVRVRDYSGITYLVFKVRAYGDFSAATEALMTTVFVMGDDIGTLRARWTQTNKGWRLRRKDFGTP